MTEVEFDKACRTTLAAVRSEYALEKYALMVTHAMSLSENISESMRRKIGSIHTLDFNENSLHLTFNNIGGVR